MADKYKSHLAAIIFSESQIVHSELEIATCRTSLIMISGHLPLAEPSNEGAQQRGQRVSFLLALLDSRR